MQGRTERRAHGGGRAQRHSAPENFTGRHRDPRRLPGPVGVATAVTLLLVMFGVGAAVMPIGLASAPDAAPTGEPVTEAVGVGILGAAPTPTTASPSPSARRTTPPPARPTPSRTPSRAPKATSGGADSREAQVVEIVNQERAANGCSSVSMNNKLAEAARLHSEDQAAHDKMSHDGSDGSSFVDRAKEAGYNNPMSENVAMGYASPTAVMDGWMNSQGHRTNILNCDAKAIGVGIAANSAGRLYWTQMFGTVA
ncbi:CAP domain-containing protein [Micromonospora sp. NBC_01796]|uniref:CAP domain-containing protein n=1 Tax=Micromonospora sp. NBC_01796 TaxID=2975987 RepID=UPI002DDA1D41|nr:CAP domain-containing protein [Micromonospora sp. NBC_01796]WSA87118.1 CAP domain-containing protein [Micromonospora sp. NBC_01796]